MRRDGCYAHLDGRGLVRVGTRVRAGDCLIGRVVEQMVHGGGGEQQLTRRCRSVFADEAGQVVEVQDMPRTKLRRVVVQSRLPTEIGDKFSARHGQKGVVGMVVDQASLPFTDSGLVPDIVINSHALPSRMTVGMLVEMLCGKRAALEGTRVDATPFRNADVAAEGERLRALGLPPDGKETMYDGETGEPLESRVFVGLCYYQRLQHFVRKKVYSRSASGPVSYSTRQPVGGRSHAGGLRMGEMERDVLLCHGATETLRSCFSSDATVVWVCGHPRCGLLACPPGPRVIAEAHCPVHGDAHMKRLRVPYPFQQLVGELRAANVALRLWGEAG